MNLTELRVVFYGTPEFSRTVLEGLLDSGAGVVLVVTRPDQPAGRGRRSSPSPVAELAARRKLPTLKPRRVGDAVDDIRQAEPDLAIVAAYGQILPKPVLDAPTHGSINVHASVLPKYRGASPIQQAILDNLLWAGISLMQMDERLDTGPVISHARTKILDRETAGALSARLAALAPDLIKQTLPDYLDGKVVARPQDEQQASTTKLLSKQDGRIDWTRSAGYLERFVRAMHPWPGAWTDLDGRRLVITSARPLPGSASPGTVISGDGLVFGTGKGLLEIERLVPAGKHEMPGADFVRGRRGQG